MPKPRRGRKPSDKVASSPPGASNDAWEQPDPDHLAPKPKRRLVHKRPHKTESEDEGASPSSPTPAPRKRRADKKGDSDYDESDKKSKPEAPKPEAPKPESSKPQSRLTQRQFALTKDLVPTEEPTKPPPRRGRPIKPKQEPAAPPQVILPTVALMTVPVQKTSPSQTTPPMQMTPPKRIPRAPLPFADAEHMQVDIVGTGEEQGETNDTMSEQAQGDDVENPVQKDDVEEKGQSHDRADSHQPPLTIETKWTPAEREALSTIVHYHIESHGPNWPLITQKFNAARSLTTMQIKTYYETKLVKIQTRKRVRTKQPGKSRSRSKGAAVGKCAVEEKREPSAEEYSLAENSSEEAKEEQ
ncbi:hypothetical protein HK097_008826 [Rhizophlyctis rosea]|uniref:Myb-like domain-containing protein n=1 Tax=Rhizophlyctis rosea TaxID=64517 RepID=A0AAD5SBY4_9FUNG|nr:hypothetical protein HK097_008826 [Rhizophlyctis rosea]